MVRTQVFEAFNLNIKRGQVTAIIGESGSGKSTLMALLQNVYNIQDGKISIGDYDLNHITTESLRDIIGSTSKNRFVCWSCN